MKYRRRGVKREHAVIGEFAAVFERLARLPGVSGVIPGRIASNPTQHPGLVLKGETATGYKLLAKTTTSIQEVFVTTRAGERAQALEALRAMVTRPSAPAPSRPAAAGRRAGQRQTGSRPWRNPGVLPEGRRSGEPLRYTAAAPDPRSWRDTPTRLGDALGTGPLRRRLLVLRLRRARWRHRFGAPLRRAPRRR